MTLNYTLNISRLYNVLLKIKVMYFVIGSYWSILEIQDVTLEAGSLSFPHPRPLPGTTQLDVPFVIVGDEAFPLKNYMMRPYPGKIFLVL